MIRFTQQHSWLCPACQTSIRHEHEPLSPRPGVIYRCHVCRLELVLNEGAGKQTSHPWSMRNRLRTSGLRLAGGRDGLVIAPPPAAPRRNFHRDIALQAQALDFAHRRRELLPRVTPRGRQDGRVP